MRAFIFLLGILQSAGGCRTVELPTPPAEHVIVESPAALPGEHITTEVRSSTTEVRHSTTSSSSFELTTRPEPPEHSWPHTETPLAPERNCCRVCRAGKACGNTCIARARTCTAVPGCACDLD